MLADATAQNTLILTCNGLSRHFSKVKRQFNLLELFLNGQLKLLKGRAGVKGQIS